MRSKKLLYDTYEKPKIYEWIILSLQHVLAMFGATILVPILVNKAAGAEVMSIPLALACSGVGTLIYIICTKGKSPVYLGSSFAFIGPVAAAFLRGGISGVTSGIITVGLIYVLFGLLTQYSKRAFWRSILTVGIIYTSFLFVFFNEFLQLFIFLFIISFQ